VFQLLLIHECIPIAYLIVKAGGKASNGQQPILDIQPEQLHQRTQLFAGSASEVDSLISIISPTLTVSFEDLPGTDSEASTLNYHDK
jgi:fructose-1,6-bisphosphatase I